MNHVFDFAIDHDYVAANVARSVNTRDIHCKEVNNKLKVYSKEEREKIIAQAELEDDVFARTIILMFCSCTRIDEIRALKWKNVILKTEQCISIGKWSEGRIPAAMSILNV